DRLRLVLESPHIFGRGESRRLDHLQGHRPIETELSRLEDDPHAAFAKDFQQLVVAEVSDSGTRFWTVAYRAFRAFCLHGARHLPGCPRGRMFQRRVVCRCWLRLVVGRALLHASSVMVRCNLSRCNLLSLELLGIAYFQISLRLARNLRI